MKLCIPTLALMQKKARAVVHITRHDHVDYFQVVWIKYIKTIILVRNEKKWLYNRTLLNISKLAQTVQKTRWEIFRPHFHIGLMLHNMQPSNH